MFSNERTTSADTPKLGDDGSAPMSTTALKALEKRPREGSTSDERNRVAQSFREPQVSVSVGSNSDIWANEGGIYCGDSHQTYPTSTNTNFPLSYGNSVLQEDWRMPFLNNPTITANFDTNVRGLEEFEPNKDVILTSVPACRKPTSTFHHNKANNNQEA